MAKIETGAGDDVVFLSKPNNVRVELGTGNDLLVVSPQFSFANSSAIGGWIQGDDTGDKVIDLVGLDPTLTSSALSSGLFNSVQSGISAELTGQNFPTDLAPLVNDPNKFSLNVLDGQRFASESDIVNAIKNVADFTQSEEWKLNLPQHLKSENYLASSASESDETSLFSVALGNGDDTVIGGLIPTLFNLEGGNNEIISFGGNDDLYLGSGTNTVWLTESNMRSTLTGDTGGVIDVFLSDFKTAPLPLKIRLTETPSISRG